MKWRALFVGLMLLALPARAEMLRVDISGSDPIFVNPWDVSVIMTSGVLPGNPGETHIEVEGLAAITAGVLGDLHHYARLWSTLDAVRRPPSRLRRQWPDRLVRFDLDPAGTPGIPHGIHDIYVNPRRVHSIRDQDPHVEGMSIVTFRDALKYNPFDPSNPVYWRREIAGSAESNARQWARAFRGGPSMDMQVLTVVGGGETFHVNPLVVGFFNERNPVIAGQSRVTYAYADHLGSLTAEVEGSPLDNARAWAVAMREP